MSQWAILKRAFVVFQKAEAKAVFYRDINNVLNTNLNLIKDDECFKRVRTSNNILITHCFDKTEGLRETLYQLLISEQGKYLVEYFFVPYASSALVEDREGIINIYKKAIKENKKIKGAATLFSFKFMPLIELADDLLKEIQEIN